MIFLKKKQLEKDRDNRVIEYNPFSSAGLSDLLQYATDNEIMFWEIPVDEINPDLKSGDFKAGYIPYYPQMDGTFDTTVELRESIDSDEPLPILVDKRGLDLIDSYNHLVQETIGLDLLSRVKLIHYRIQRHEGHDSSHQQKKAQGSTYHSDNCSLVGLYTFNMKNCENCASVVAFDNPLSNTTIKGVKMTDGKSYIFDDRVFFHKAPNNITSTDPVLPHIRHILITQMYFSKDMSCPPHSLSTKVPGLITGTLGLGGKPLPKKRTKRKKRSKRKRRTKGKKRDIWKDN